MKIRWPWSHQQISDNTQLAPPIAYHPADPFVHPPHRRRPLAAAILEIRHGRLLVERFTLTPKIPETIGRKNNSHINAQIRLPDVTGVLAKVQGSFVYKKDKHGYWQVHYTHHAKNPDPKRLVLQKAIVIHLGGAETVLSKEGEGCWLGGGDVLRYAPDDEDEHVFTVRVRC